MERVGEEGVLDVGGDELLVLLLVLEAEGDAAGGFVFEGMLHEGDHGGVDVGAVARMASSGGREKEARSFFSGISPREL